MLRRIAIASVMLAASTGLGLAQDAAAGEKVFAKCKTCHAVGEGAKAKVGPPLNGIVGRKAASWEGYSYSKASADHAATTGNWDEAKLAEYLVDPSKYVGGASKMAFKLPAEKDRKDVIAYLAQFGMDGKKK